MLWKCIEEGPKLKNFPRKVKEQDRGEKEKMEKEGKWIKILTTLVDFGDLVFNFFNTYVEKGQVLFPESF